MTTDQTAYVDNNGRARLRPSIVGFLDLLGFSHQVTTAKDPDDSQLLLDNIAAAINDSRDYVRRASGTTSSAKLDGWAVKFFSDNLVLGYSFEDSGVDLASAAWFVIRCAQRYQLRMALNGMFLRGALTQGPVCITDEIIFGSTLIECYQLESKAAIVPRVILAEPLSKVIVESAELHAISPEARDGVCRDVDGWWFINYLDAALNENRVDWSAIERHKQSVLQSLASTTRHDVLPKFGWACRYHNMFCHWRRNDPGYDDRFRIDRDDEQSTIVRLGELTRFE